jgi:multidrug resistance efflux pump
LAFLLSGRIFYVLVDEGHFFERDQTLAVVSQSEYQAGYEQAKAHLESSISNLQRLEMAWRSIERHSQMRLELIQKRSG